ncbi:MAG: zf-HC2 domain-containing protein [Anaerolineae bacterium]|jgi:anti-sigma factor RsiW
MKHETCQHLLDDLSDFLDGEASAEVCAEIERHLAGCEDCRVMVDTLRKTIILYHDLPQPTLSQSAKERLYRSLDLEAFLPDS